MDLLDVYSKAEAAISRARKGEGPTLIECKTYRYMGHSRFENSGYRTKEEIELWKKRDPIDVFEKKLADNFNITEKEFNDIKQSIEIKMDEAVDYAKNCPDTDPTDYKKYIFAG
jgi:acetoin:2,6-dichlorophenolindophenol oxidoreductase subunit alpha